MGLLLESPFIYFWIGPIAALVYVFGLTFVLTLLDHKYPNQESWTTPVGFLWPLTGTLWLFWLTLWLLALKPFVWLALKVDRKGEQLGNAIVSRNIPKAKIEKTVGDKLTDR